MALAKNFVNKLCNQFNLTLNLIRQNSRSAIITKVPNSKFSAATNNKELYRASSVISERFFSTTAIRNGLSEFFEDPKNWGEAEIKCGRSWRKEELRIKSNSDLHKLWYVLLKERNMLLTTEHEYKRECEAMPNPERIDKVEESMKNLEDVVRERNRAYHLLETGYHGERPTELVEDALGMRRFYRLCEHVVPREWNKKWRENHMFNFWDPPHVFHFKKLYRERCFKDNARRRRIYKRYIRRVFREYPDASVEAINEKFPDIHVDTIKSQLEKF